MIFHNPYTIAKLFLSYLVALFPAFEPTNTFYIAVILAFVAGIVRWIDIKGTPIARPFWKVVLSSGFTGTVFCLAAQSYFTDMGAAGILAIAGLAGFGGLPVLRKLLELITNKLN